MSKCPSQSIQIKNLYSSCCLVDTILFYHPASNHDLTLSVLPEHGASVIGPGYPELGQLTGSSHMRGAGVVCGLPGVVGEVKQMNMVGHQALNTHVVPLPAIDILSVGAATKD